LARRRAQRAIVAEQRGPAGFLSGRKTRQNASMSNRTIWY